MPGNNILVFIWMVRFM